MTALVLTTLDECERVIERGLHTFVEVGAALLTIRDERLYRAEHSTFDDYCRDRWQISDRRARQLMDAAQIGTTVPIANEAQARELTGLPAETQREVFAAATEATQGKPTASAIREARQSIAPRPTVAITPTTREQFLADRETGEVLSPEDYRRQRADAFDVPDDLPTNPIANARAIATRQPAVVAGKAVERLRTTRLTFEAVGTPADLITDMANDPDVLDSGGYWLEEIDAAISVLTNFAAALRRRNIRSAK